MISVSTFESRVRSMMVGQDNAVREAANQFAIIKAEMNQPKHTLANFFMPGPTGVGKTLLCESVAYAIHEDEDQLIKVNGGEFTHGHEVSKLLGSPPGYLGHRETNPIFTQDIINTRAGGSGICVVLFDEIEKAHADFHNLLLGILDKGHLTDGTNRTVDMTRCWIFMTSNIGEKEMKGVDASERERVVTRAMKSHFSPEFINRIDVTCIFDQLSRSEIAKIVKREAGLIGPRNNVSFTVTDKAIEEIVSNVHSSPYGAREMKRFFRHNIIVPLANHIIKYGRDRDIFCDHDRGKFTLDSIENEKKGIYPLLPPQEAVNG